MRKAICNLGRYLFAGVAILVVPGAGAQQQPQVAHGQVSVESGARGLQPVLEALKGSGAPVWLGYSEPVVEQFSSGWSSDRVAYLEGRPGDRDETNGHDGQRATFDRANVLLRVEGGEVKKVQVEAPDRELDAGGLRFVWVANVAADDSIRTLARVAEQASERGVRDQAVSAVAVHGAAAATPVLVQMAAPGKDEELREKAAFWLAAQRGHEGFVALQRMAHEDGEARFREKLAFDMTVTRDAGAAAELVRMAHEDASPQVRRQAQFWMATKGGKKVAAELRGAAENDADGGVRKAAVFAISRLPGDEATTQLIALADTSRDPGVRKQAVFWLGQSRDPRALEYLTKLLAR